MATDHIWVHFNFFIQSFLEAGRFHRCLNWTKMELPICSCECIKVGTQRHDYLHFGLKTLIKETGKNTMAPILQWLNNKDQTKRAFQYFMTVIGTTLIIWRFRFGLGEPLLNSSYWVKSTGNYYTISFNQTVSSNGSSMFITPGYTIELTSVSEKTKRVSRT